MKYARSHKCHALARRGIANNCDGAQLCINGQVIDNGTAQGTDYGVLGATTNPQYVTDEMSTGTEYVANTLPNNASSVPMAQGAAQYVTDTAQKTSLAERNLSRNAATSYNTASNVATVVSG